MREPQFCYEVGDVESCFEELISCGKVSIDKMANIINKYQPISFPELPPLVVANSAQLIKAGCSQQLQQLQQQFYEQKFIPSPDLLLGYQQIYIKSVSNQQPTTNSNNNIKGQGMHNNKLNRLYRERSLSNNNSNNPYCSQINAVNQPVTLPYRALSSTYNQIQPRAENKRVLIEQRQQTIIQQLKHNTHQIQTTIPIIQHSLFQNQLKRLHQKQIHLDNMVGVKGWKLKRQEIINRLATNKNNM